MKNLLYLCFILVFITACVKPKACMEISKTIANVNENINFTSCSSNTNYTTWDLGDGTEIMSDDFVHAYKQSGIYVVTITAHFYENRKDPDHRSMTVVIR